VRYVNYLYLCVCVLTSGRNASTHIV